MNNSLLAACCSACSACIRSFRLSGLFDQYPVALRPKEPLGTVSFGDDKDSDQSGKIKLFDQWRSKTLTFDCHAQKLQKWWL